MSLVFCPECGHEISANAVACPSCGRPIAAAPVVERKVVAVTPVRREGGVPPWAIVAIGVIGVILLFVIFMMYRQSDDLANTNINVNAAGRRTTQVPASDSTGVTVPPSGDQTVTTTNVPGTATAAPVEPLPDKGAVVINAKVTTSTSRGAPQAVRNAKFYLLDKDVESILNDARIEPIEGNSLAGSLGLAVVFPDRYGDFWRSAMRAINSHAKYSGTTDSSGSASLKGIVPNAYHLFGITRVGRGFALWDSQISIIAGENVLNLSPQSVTEIPDSSG